MTPAEGADSPRAAPAGIALVGLTALAIAMGIGRFAFTPILPMMQQDSGLSVRDGAWLASANYLGYLVGALSATVIRVRATTAIRAGLLAIGLVTLSMGLTHGLLTWLALRALAGVGSAWVLICASAWCLGKLGAAGRPALGGTVFAGVGIGIALAGGVCLVLMAAGAGSAQAWRGLGGLSLAGTVAVWRRLAAEEDARAPGDPAAAGHGYRWDLESVRLVLCYGVFGFGYIIPASFVPAMARELVSDPLLFGAAWPVFGVAAAISTLAAAAGMQRRENRRLWALGHGIMALGVALPAWQPSIGGIMVAALLVGGTFMVTTMAGMQEARTVGGSRATSLMAWMTTAFATGQIAGPLLVSLTVGPDAEFSRPLLTASLLLAVTGAALVRPVRRADTPRAGNDGETRSTGSAVGGR